MDVTQPENVTSIATGKLAVDLFFNLADTSGKQATELTIKSTYTDNYADNIRSEIADEGTDGIQKSFLEYITKYYTDAESTKAIEIKDNEENNTINIVETYKIDDIWKTEEGESERKYVYFYGDLLYSPLRNIKAKSRIEPLALKYPANIEENIYIILPRNWTIKEETQRVETDNYYFEFNSFLRGNQLRLSYSYRSLKDYIEGKDIKQYIKDTKKIKDNLSYYITWGSGSMQTTIDSNPYIVCLSILVIVCTAIFFMQIYQRPAEYNLQELIEARSIGGWIMITAICFPFGPIAIISEAINSNVYSMSLWEALKSLKTIDKVSIGTIYTIEAIAFALKVTWLILLAFLLYNRRKTFPAQYRLFLLFAIGFNVFKFAANCFINLKMGYQITNPTIVISNLLGIVSCILWYL